MQAAFEFLLILLLFAAGIRLSAFFSGGETGFYRLSLPRVSIDAQAGDRVSQKLLWFARHPASFVSTTLVGNNLANYVTTLAISLGVVQLFGRVTEALDVGSTLLLSPVIFLFGELLPKNLYYRSPTSLLRRDSTLFGLFYWLFLPMTWPLVRITKWLERFNQQQRSRVDVVFGRSRLVQLMSQGQHEGVLTDVQTRLAAGVLQTAPQPILESMIPSSRVLGVDETATREELLDFARKYDTPIICLKRPDSTDDWYAYVRTVDVALDTRPRAAFTQSMPVLTADATKLDALQQLQASAALLGVIRHDNITLGIINTRGLVEQLFRPQAAAE